jgi:hypothetical protein
MEVCCVDKAAFFRQNMKETPSVNIEVFYLPTYAQ